MVTKIQIRRSTTVDVPTASSFAPGEPGYSFLSGKLFIKSPVTDAMEEIGGKNLVDQVQNLQQALTEVQNTISQVNRVPVTGADTANIADSVPSYTGNLLSNDSDPDSDPISVTSVTYASVPRTVGSQFATTYGTMLVNASGAYTFTPSAAARLLTTGQNVVENFSYTISDNRGGVSAPGSLALTITGSNQAPVTTSDTVTATSSASSQTGNVLSNDTDPENTALTIQSWTVDGVSGTYLPGQTTDIPTYGTFTMTEQGAWTRTKTDDASGNITIRYLATDGVNVTQGILTIVVSAVLTSVASNPVTVALTGTRTFNVGPGQTYEDVGSVPWYSLSAGDVVNIFHKSTPYVAKFGLFAQGTANAPIIINGVTDSNGNRPIISGAGAPTNLGTMPGGEDNLFAPGNEGFGVITIKRRPSTSTSENPCWITIQNLEVTGGGATDTYTNSLGNTVAYGFSAGIWCQPSSDITLRNNVIYGNSQGVFTMSKPGGIGESCQRFKVLYNRIYGNGAVGSGYEHGCYLQGYDFIVEGNYLGRGLAGAGGSTYKSRIGKEVLRYNWIESTARAVDMVHPEFTDAFVAYPDFGIDYMYGNVLVNSEDLDGAAWRPVHYGSDSSDGGGEWGPSYGGSSPANHRKKLYFFANTYFSKNNNPQTDQFVFQLSWPQTICEAWGNIFVLRGSQSQLSLMYLAGQLNLRGSNIIVGYGTIQDYSTLRGATTQSAQVNRLGSVVALDPLFSSEAFYDYALTEGSPAVDLYSGLPAGIPASVGQEHPVLCQPIRRSNGIEPRPVIGTTDLGAMERDPTAPPRVAPVMAQAPSFNVANQYVVGSTVSVIDPTWLYNPSSVTRTWQRFSGGSFQDISGASGLDYTLTSQDVGNMRVKYVASNVVGSTTEYSSTFAVTDQAAAGVVQIASAGDTYPSSLKTAVCTFSQSPVVGNTLAAFVIAGESVSDNYGNVWVKRQDLDSGYGSTKYQLYTCVVSNTGTNFQVTATSLSSWVCNAVVYEVSGLYDTSSGNAQGAGGTDGSISITASAPNQRIIAGFSAGRSWGAEAPTVNSPWITGARLLLASGYDPTQTVVHGVSSSAGANTVTGVYTGQQYLVKIAATFTPSVTP